MRRCEHGTYWPEAHAIAFACQFCNPLVNEPQEVAADTPKFNRRGSMDMTETGKLPKCPNCKGDAILTVSKGGQCAICKFEFEIGVANHLRANNKQPGVCDECGSGVHFVRSGRRWECADCGHVYKAPKGAK